MSAVSPDSKTVGLSGLPDKVGRHLRSPSTRLAALAGLLTDLCYAYAHDSWTNPALIGVAIFFAVFMPTYTRISNKAELWANNRFGFVTAGRFGRFVSQLAFNLVVFAVMLWGGGVKHGALYGSSAKERPFVAVDKPLSVSDLHATIFTAMGISPKTAFDVERRPFYATEDGTGKAAGEIFG